MDVAESGGNDRSLGGVEEGYADVQVEEWFSEGVDGAISRM